MQPPGSEHTAKTVGIAVICKTPEAEKSKTRLSPPLLPDQCATLSACFIRDLAANIQTLCGNGDVAGYALYTPAGSEDRLKALLPHEFGLIPQSSGNLGERLHRGVEQILACGHHGAIIVNADSPTLPPAILREAATRLIERDCVVLSRADDGGYIFIGLSHPYRRVFEDITWSTDRVHTQTQARAREIGLEICNVDPWYDIDDEASLRILQRELAGELPPFAAKQTRPAAAPSTRRCIDQILSQVLFLPVGK